MLCPASHTAGRYPTRTAVSISLTVCTSMMPECRRNNVRICLSSAQYTSGVPVSSALIVNNTEAAIHATRRCTFSDMEMDMSLCVQVMCLYLSLDRKKRNESAICVGPMYYPKLASCPRVPQ